MSRSSPCSLSGLWATTSLSEPFFLSLKINCDRRREQLKNKRLAHHGLVRAETKPALREATCINKVEEQSDRGNAAEKMSAALMRPCPCKGACAMRGCGAHISCPDIVKRVTRCRRCTHALHTAPHIRYSCSLVCSASVLRETSLCGLARFAQVYYPHLRSHTQSPLEINKMEQHTCSVTKHAPGSQFSATYSRV